MYQKYALLTLLFPPLGIPLGAHGFYQDIKNWKTYVFCLALAFSAFAFCYTPTSPTDLTRYFDFVEKTSQSSLIEAMTSGLYTGQVSRLYGFTLLCWIVGKLQIPHALPAISVFLVYYISLYTFGFSCEKKGLSPKIRMLILLFISCSVNFFSITNNIRNILGFSLVGFACFRETIENKRNLITYLLYLISISFHPTCLILIAFRLILLLRPTRLRILISLLLLLVRPALFFLNTHIAFFWRGRFLTYVGKLVYKGYRYFYVTSDWSQEVLASGSEKVFRILYIGIAILFFFLISDYLLKNKKTKERDFLSFILFVSSFAIACAPMDSPQYWRFTASVCLFSGVIFSYLFQRSKQTSFRWCTIICVCLMSMFCLVLWGRNLILYSNETAMVLSSLYSSPFIIVATQIMKLLL